MKDKFRSFITLVKAGAARFFRTKGIYAAAGLLGLSLITAAVLHFALPKDDGGEDMPGPTGAPVVDSGDEQLALLQTPKPSPTQEPTPVPDFTEAPVSPTPAAQPKWNSPVTGEVIWGYAADQLIYSRTLKQWMTHMGVDIASPKGSEVYAVFGGTVEAVIEDDMLGVCVQVKGDNGFTAVYANLQKEPAVKEGDVISARHMIGLVGDTAVSECADKSHLHFELWKNEAPVDPLLHIKVIHD